MKAFTTAVALLLTSTVSFGAFAAKEISKEQAEKMNLHSLGTVDTDSTIDPMDAKHRLSKKADEKGGEYYVIIAADENNRVSATAEVFKK